MSPWPTAPRRREAARTPLCDRQLNRLAKYTRLHRPEDLLLVFSAASRWPRAAHCPTERLPPRQASDDRGMGVVWSVLGAYSSSSDGTSQENARRGNAGDSVSAVSTGTRTEPQFLADVRAEPAAWTHDGYCRSFQRFIGYLPDSPVSSPVLNRDGFAAPS